MSTDKKNIYGGIGAGLAQIITGHPFDTVKVRYINSEKSNIIKCVREIKNKGWKNFYRGIYSPLLGSIAMNVKTFYTYSLVETHITSNSFVAGGLTGLSLSTIEAPTDLIKTRMQINTTFTYNKVLKEIGYQNLYRGFGITAYRNIISVGMFFSGYHYTKSIFKNEYTGALVGGSVAGFLCWAPSYPLDNIKTRIQSCDSSSIIAVTKKIYKQEGVRGFYKGFIPCITRAMFVNPFVFLAYEFGMKLT